MLLAPTGKRLRTLFVTLGLKKKKKKEMQGIRQERVKYTINSTHMHSQIERINVIYLMLLNGITCFYSFEINRVFH